jgi:hypothetical protein
VEEPRLRCGSSALCTQLRSRFLRPLRGLAGSHGIRSHGFAVGYRLSRASRVCATVSQTIRPMAKEDAERAETHLRG